MLKTEIFETRELPYRNVSLLSMGILFAVELK